MLVPTYFCLFAFISSYRTFSRLLNYQGTTSSMSHKTEPPTQYQASTRQQTLAGVIPTTSRHKRLSRIKLSLSDLRRTNNCWRESNKLTPEVLSCVKLSPVWIVPRTRSRDRAIYVAAFVSSVLVASVLICGSLVASCLVGRVSFT